MVQGFASSVGAVASIIGLIMGGLLYNWIGARVFVVSAVTVFAVAVLTLIIRDR